MIFFIEKTTFIENDSYIYFLIVLKNYKNG